MSYGTIPTSSSPDEHHKAGLGVRRPWRQMFDLWCFNLPESFSDAFARIRTNCDYFLMNYAIVVLLILFLSLLWHPISLIVFLAMTAVWLFLYFLREEPLTVFAWMISDRVVLIVLAAVTIAVLLPTHATSNVLAALLVGVVVVLTHGAVRKTDDLFSDEEAAEGLFRSSGVPISS